MTRTGSAMLVEGRMGQRIKIGENSYDQVVLKVESLDEHGRPETVLVVREEDNLELGGGEWFITGWIHSSASQTAQQVGCDLSKPGAPKPSVL